MSLDDALRRMNQQAHEIWKMQQDRVNQIAEEKLQEKELLLANNEYLRQISHNTKGIDSVIDLVRKNNEINERTFELFQEVSAVMTAKTPEEADSKLREVMNKANQANEDWSTIQTLLGWGKMVGKLTFPESNLFD